MSRKLANNRSPRWAFMERFERDHGSRPATPEDRGRAVVRDLLAHRSPLTITDGMRSALRRRRHRRSGPEPATSG